MQVSKYDKGKIIKWQGEDKKKKSFTLKQLMKKEATDLKGSMERYIAGLGGRRGNGKYCNDIMISKRVILSTIFYYTSFEYLNGLPAYFENWPNFKKKNQIWLTT